MPGWWEKGLQRRLSPLLCCLLAVLVNSLLNLIDAATYGRILFPIQAPLFAHLDYLGIALFLACTATSQMIVSLFSSFSRGATACAMVENIPFYHSICFMIATRVLSEDAMLSTVLAAYFLVTILTALMFLGLALLGLDRLIHKFPRVVLVGSMGGIGLFLLGTALEMATGDPFDPRRLGRLFASWTVFGLWFLGLASAVTAIIADAYYCMPGVIPGITMFLFVVFYLIIQMFPYTLEELREFGWLMRGPSSTADPVDLLTKLKVSSIDPYALLQALPTIAAAAVFGALHVPINVPSFSRLTNQPFSMKRELYTQSISNIACAFTSLIPSYFVYTNSLLFIRAGALHRFAGLLLAIVTAVLLLCGMQMIGLMPSVITLFWIFYLGLCLVREALVSHWICSRAEYILVLCTVASMPVFGFLPGIALGSLLTATYTMVRRQCLPPSDTSPTEQHEPAIKSPALEALVRRCEGHCLIVAFSRLVYFGSITEEMQRLTFTTLSCRMLLLDFHNTCFIDLNAREAILAALTSGMLSEQSVVVLGLADDALKRYMRSIPHVRTSDERPEEWLHRLVSETVAPSDGRPAASDDEAVHLIISAEGIPILDEEDWSHYEQLRSLQDGILARLEGQSQLIRLKGGEPVAAHHPATGILVIQRGRMRQRTKRYAAGAWVGLEEYLAGVKSTAVAITPTVARFIPKSVLDTVPLEELQKLRPCTDPSDQT